MQNYRVGKELTRFYCILVMCLNPYPATIFVLKILTALTPAEDIQLLLRQDLFMEANNMNPDQTAPKGAALSGSIIHIDCNIRYLRT